MWLSTEGMQELDKQIREIGPGLNPDSVDSLNHSWVKTFSPYTLRTILEINIRISLCDIYYLLLVHNNYYIHIIVNSIIK